MDAVARLRTAGFRAAAPVDLSTQDPHAGELHLLGPLGLQVDLHWHLVNQPHLRSRLRLSTDRLLGRTVRRDLAGSEVPVLDDVAALLHLGVHGWKSGANRLRYFKDVQMFLLDRKVDTDEVVRLAGESRTGLGVALVLDRAHRLLGAPVPDGLVRRLAAPGHGYLGLVRAVDAVDPVGDRPVGRSPSLMVARSALDDGWSSYAGLAQRVVRRGVAPRQHQPPLFARPAARAYDEPLPVFEEIARNAVAEQAALRA